MIILNTWLCLAGRLKFISFFFMLRVAYFESTIILSVWTSVCPNARPCFHFLTFSLAFGGITHTCTRTCIGAADMRARAHTHAAHAHTHVSECSTLPLFSYLLPCFWRYHTHSHNAHAAHAHALARTRTCSRTHIHTCAHTHTLFFILHWKVSILLQPTLFNWTVGPYTVLCICI